MAFILCCAIKPVVAYFEERGVPRQLTTILIMVFVYILLGLVLYWLIPPLIIETNLLIKHLPEMISNINPQFLTDINTGSFNQYLPNITNQLLNLVKMVFGNLIFLVSTSIFSIYLTIDKNMGYNMLIKLFDEHKTNKMIRIANKIEAKMSAWFWGELTLMFVVGGMVFIGLNILGVKYVFPLSILAGLLEVFKWGETSVPVVPVVPCRRSSVNLTFINTS